MYVWMMCNHSPLPDKYPMKSGFTLIEMSIVLVIIGLIVGGILTGQDLIKAAEQRATIAQIDKYKTAVNTFEAKFNGIPGDLNETQASNFGLFAMSTATTIGGPGAGDGNGLIEGGAANTTALNGEVVAFFRHLSDAGLIDGSYAATVTTTGTITTSGTLGAAITSGSGIDLLLPAAKMRRGNYIIPASANSINYFIISGMSGVNINVGGVVTGETNNLTPIEAYAIDTKIDDGLPGSGSVWAINGGSSVSTYATVSIPTPTGGAAGFTACIVNTVTPNTYNVQMNSPYCSLRLSLN